MQVIILASKRLFDERQNKHKKSPVVQNPPTFTVLVGLRRVQLVCKRCTACQQPGGERLFQIPVKAERVQRESVEGQAGKGSQKSPIMNMHSSAPPASHRKPEVWRRSILLSTVQQPLFTSCYPGRRPSSNPAILGGPDRVGGGFCLPPQESRALRWGEEVKSSTGQVPARRDRVAPGRTSISDCHQRLCLTMSRYTSFLSAGGSDRRLEIIVRLPRKKKKACLKAWGSFRRFSWRASAHFHRFLLSD